MEPILIYTDTNKADVGAIRTFSLDMAFGSDEQDFEASFSVPQLSGGELLYIDGTEYGGIIDSVTQSTETDVTVYKGRTWHGMLAGKVVKPPANQDYYTLSGDANTCIRSLLSYVGLNTVLTGRSTASGINISSYKFDRFTNAYSGLLRMLNSADAVLRIERHDGITELWAEQRATIGDEADSDIMDFSITDSYRVPNHLVCTGEGELQDRVVVDLYADASGNVSTTQTLTGVDEIAVLYNYNNADAAELTTKGTTELRKYQQGGGADISVNSRGDWHIGDKLQVRDNRTGTVIVSTIAKKIVKVENGVLSVEYEVGDASAQAYGGGGDAETNLVTPIANGGTGATTAQGARANLNVPGLSQVNRFMNNGQLIKLTAVDSALSNNGVSSSVYNNWGIVDKNDRYLLFSQTGALADGSIRAEFGARNFGTGANVTNLIRLIVDNAGGRSVELSVPEAWRTALQNAREHFRSSTLDRDDTTDPSAAVWSNSDVYFYDKDSEPLGYIRMGRATTGAMTMRFQVNNEPFGGGTAVNNSLEIAVRRDGTCRYNIGSPAAFREAIGMSVWPSDTSGTASSGTFLRGDGVWSAILYNILSLRDSSIDRDAASVTADDWGDRYLRFQDKDGEIIGAVRCVQRNGGRMDAYLEVYNEKSDGTQVENLIRAGVDKAGACSYGLSDPAAFRSTLALNTWTAVSLGDFITLASGWSSQSTAIRYNAALGIVRFYANWKVNAAKSGNQTIGTVKEAYRPKVMEAALPSLTSVSQAAHIDTSGAFKANMTVAANGTVYYTGEYHIGA